MKRRLSPWIKPALSIAVTASLTGAWSASAQDCDIALRFQGSQITAVRAGVGGGSSRAPDDTEAKPPPSARAVLFGTGITRDDGITRQFDRLEIVSDDFVGWSITLPTDVPPASVWMALDLQDGCWTVDSPSGQDRLVPFPTPAFFLPSNPPASGVQEIALTWAHAHALVWRPDGSLLSQEVFDGTGADFDSATNGAVTVDAVALGAVDGSPSARPVEAGDVVAVLNPLDWTIAVKEVTAIDAANGVISP